MVTGVAASTVSTPVVPSTAANTAHNGSDFKAVYSNVPAGDNSHGNDAGSKSKPVNSKEVVAKKSSPTGDSERPSAAGIQLANVAANQTSSLLLSIPLLGLVADKAVASDENTIESESGSSSAQSGVASKAEPTPISVAMPRTESLAFSLHLTKSNRLSQDLPEKSAQSPARNQPPTEPVKAVRNPTAPPQSAPPKSPEPVQPVARVLTPAIAAAVKEFVAASSSESRIIEVRTPASEPARITETSAIHDIQAIMPDAPKTSPASEILLHIAGNDHSSASVRVVDRAGTVNVSVHASDPEVRTSLRSNLGDLASQLSAQGFKTEVKAAPAAARSDNSQDSRHDQQRSSGQQQQFSHSERQPQKDRRANAGRWLDEFEENTSGNPSNPGGTH
jgi:hypothetical protein